MMEVFGHRDGLASRRDRAQTSGVSAALTESDALTSDCTRSR